MSRRGWWVSALRREHSRRDSSRGIYTLAVARESCLGHYWGMGLLRMAFPEIGISLTVDNW